MATQNRLRSPKLTYDVDLLRAMADEQRQKILQYLCTPGAGKMMSFAVTDIADNFELTTSTVSHHLQLLKRVDLVRVEKSGKERKYRLNLDLLHRSVGQFYDLLTLVEKATEKAAAAPSTSDSTQT